MRHLFVVTSRVFFREEMALSVIKGDGDMRDFVPPGIAFVDLNALPCRKAFRVVQRVPELLVKFVSTENQSGCSFAPTTRPSATHNSSGQCREDVEEAAFHRWPL